MGVVKGDTRSLGYGSHGNDTSFEGRAPGAIGPPGLRGQVGRAADARVRPQGPCLRFNFWGDVEMPG